MKFKDYKPTPEELELLKNAARFVASLDFSSYNNRQPPKVDWLKEQYEAHVLGNPPFTFLDVLRMEQAFMASGLWKHDPDDHTLFIVTLGFGVFKFDGITGSNDLGAIGYALLPHFKAGGIEQFWEWFQQKFVSATKGAFAVQTFKNIDPELLTPRLKVGHFIQLMRGTKIVQIRTIIS